MFDPTTLTDLVFVAISLTALATILRGIGAGDPLDLGSMFAHPWETTWPRGVQEEEPRPWRLEHLGGHDDVPRPIGLTRAAEEVCDADAWDTAA